MVPCKDNGRLRIKILAFVSSDFWRVIKGYQILENYGGLYESFWQDPQDPLT